MGEGKSPSQRLEAVLELYRVARRIFHERTSAGGWIEPDEWRAILECPSGTALTDVETSRLRQEHRTRAFQAREEAANRSSIDLDEVRRLGLEEPFAKELPKGAMLHSHLNGTLTPKSVLDLATRANPRWLPRRVPRLAEGFPRKELEFLRSYPQWASFLSLRPADAKKLLRLFRLPEGPVEPERFEGVFRLLSLLEPGSAGSSVADVATSFLARAARCGLSHVEVTRTLPTDSRTLRRACRGLQEASEDTGVEARFILSFDRDEDPATIRERIRQLLERPPPPQLVAVDIVGQGPNGRFFEPAQVVFGELLTARAGGMSHVAGVAHAGFTGDPEEVRDAMIFGARRIGHGLGLAADPVLLEWAARQELAIESCPTSNLRLGQVPHLRAHPMLLFLRLGLRVSLATDDEGLLGTNICQEWAMVIGETDITYAEVRKMVMHSIKTSLAERPVREKLRDRTAAELARFEDRWRRRLARSRAGGECRS